VFSRCIHTTISGPLRRSLHEAAPCVQIPAAGRDLVPRNNAVAVRVCLWVNPPALLGDSRSLTVPGVADEQGQSTTLLGQASISRESALQWFGELFSEDGLQPVRVSKEGELYHLGLGVWFAWATRTG